MAELNKITQKFRAPKEIELVDSVGVACVHSRASKGIIDLLLPQNSIGLSVESF